MEESLPWLTFFPHLYFLLFFLSSFKRLQKKKNLSIVNPRGEGEDMMSCKTYALNIKVVKLVKLKAILENRKRNIYALGSGLQSFYHGAARACRGTGNDCQQAWEGRRVKIQWGCMLSMSNQMSTCVTGLPLFSGPEWPVSGFQGSKKNGGREKNKVCS